MIVRRDRKDYGWYEAYLCGRRSTGATECTQGAVQRAIVDSAVLAYFERGRTGRGGNQFGQTCQQLHVLRHGGVGDDPRPPRGQPGHVVLRRL